MARQKPNDFAKPPLIGDKAESRRGVTSDILPVQSSGTYLSSVTRRDLFVSHEEVSTPF